METSFFHPSTASSHGDKLAERLRGVARFLLILTGGLLPIIFIPSAYIPFSASKTLILAAALTLAVFFYALSMLREGRLTFRFSWPIIGIWAVAGVAVVSAALSGDARDSIFGDAFDSYSAGFLLLMAAIVTVAGVFSESKQSVIKLYGTLVFSAIVVTIFHLVRLMFGPETLSFGMFSGSTTSTLGSWNGLAIFYGLVVLLSLIALQQLPLSRVGRYISIAVVVISLAMLAIVNFSASWWVLAIVSGVMTLHLLVRNFWKKGGEGTKESESFDLILVSVGILIASVTFLVGGASISGAISEKLGVGFVEVRPSAMATVEIARSVYASDLLLGAGPNRFIDVWRLHKDPTINQTIFWNTQFDSGYSYLLTNFINTGLLGILAWSLFFVGFLGAGARFLLRAPTNDRFWYFIGLSSLVTSIYFWIMSAIYVPPPAILLLTALTTGVFLASYARLVPGRSLVLSARDNRLQGVALIVFAVLIVSGTGYAFYASASQVAGVYEFNKVLGTVQEGDTIDTIDDRIVATFESNENDAFARQIAFHQLSQMRAILTTPEPTDVERQTFERAAARGIEAAQLSVNLDPTDPFNHQILGQIYSILAVVGVEGAADRALGSFTNAKNFDPHNPLLPLLEADLALQREDATSARSLAETAINLKPNYTEALFFLAQLDINEGNVDRAITIVNGIAQLEPQNPARRYQLGVLLAGAERLDEAVAAFEQAVALDPQYANARYFLALGYVEQGKVEEAIEQLTVVRGLNESNAMVDDMIIQLRETGSLGSTLTDSEPVTDRDAEPGSVTEEDLDNGLVTSSNPVPGDADTTEEPTEEPVVTEETQ